MCPLLEVVNTAIASNISLNRTFCMKIKRHISSTKLGHKYVYTPVLVLPLVKVITYTANSWATNCWGGR
jgi:hypothetical protein